MKIGRNDPCPCGSGKKYKHCCLRKQEFQQTEDLLWHQIQRILGVLHPQLIKFADKHFGDEAVNEAWETFMAGEDEGFSHDTLHLQIFLPWFFYEWNPESFALEDNPKLEPLRDQVLAQVFLEKHRQQLEPLAVRFIEQCCATPFGFYEIVSAKPGEGLDLRDILTGEEFFASEQSGSMTAQAGYIVFGKAVRIDHVVILEACAPLLFPPIEMHDILELREEIYEEENPPSTELLKSYGLIMLDTYLNIYERLHDPAMTEFLDSEEIAFELHRLIYDIESPGAAFEALKHLAIASDEDEMLENAEFDRTGQLQGVSFPWLDMKNPENEFGDIAFLGSIHIEGQLLIVEVDSKEVAQIFRQLIIESLPSARYKTTAIECFQSQSAHDDNES